MTDFIQVPTRPSIPLPIHLVLSSLDEYTIFAQLVLDYLKFTLVLQLDIFKIFYKKLKALIYFVRVGPKTIFVTAPS